MSYPGGGIDSFSTKVDGVDDIAAAHVNAVQAALVAIETELGLGLHGSLADLATRLAVALNNDGTLKTAQVIPAAGAILHSMLAAGAVQSDSILDGTITGADIAATTISGSNLQNGTVGTTQLAGQAATTAKIADLNVTCEKLSVNAAVRRHTLPVGTVPTTGSVEIIMLAPASGNLTAAKFLSATSLAQDNTNYIEITGVNKLQNGSGTAQLFAASPANTTKVTGGGVLTAYVPYEISGATGAVAGGDILVFTVTVHGTLPGALLECVASLTILPTG